MRSTTVKHEFGRSRARRLALLFCSVCAVALLTTAARAANSPDRYSVIREAQTKVVKIYGAGGLRRMEAYQTGILISPDGHVLTALSYVLDTNELTVVLNDGRRFTADSIGSDPVRELVLLKLPLEDETVPYFDLSHSATAGPGERILALSNLYGIAAGEEAVSVLHGVVTAVAPLAARRGIFQSQYRDLVYVIDAPANNPGAAGGALISWQGQLLGVLGKELKSELTGSWLNYAIPVEQFADVVDDMIAGRTLQPSTTELAAPDEPLTLADLGLVLAPNLLPRTPPYVDSVLPGSSAAQAGLLPDDLIVLVAGQPIASCTEVIETTARRERYQPIKLSVLRDGRLIEVELSASNYAEDP